MTLDALVEVQRRIGALAPPPWQPPTTPLVIAGCFTAYARGEQGPGHAGDRSHVGAVAWLEGGGLVASAVVPAVAGASYVPGLLAAREAEGLIAALEQVRAIAEVDVVLVDGTGRDHPRRAGLAVHVGHDVGLPSVGVTHRPLHAAGPEPGARVGDRSPLTLDGEQVGWWLRTRAGTRPVAVHAGWRTSAPVAAEVVIRALDGTRTPAPLREARQVARLARAGA